MAISVRIRNSMGVFFQNRADGHGQLGDTGAAHSPQMPVHLSPAQPDDQGTRCPRRQRARIPGTPLRIRAGRGGIRGWPHRRYRRLRRRTRAGSFVKCGAYLFHRTMQHTICALWMEMQARALVHVAVLYLVRNSLSVLQPQLLSILDLSRFH